MGKSFVTSILWLKNKLGVKTYVVENIIVALALICTARIAQKSMIERVGVIAVFLTFCYAQIADRLHEKEQYRQQQTGYIPDKTTVECHRKLPRFYYAKELCWTIYFVYLGAWSALVGVALFLLYTPRRRLYRKHHPLA